MGTNDGTNDANGEGGEEKPTETKKRGFAALSPQKKKEIAQKGGQTAHRRGRAHKFTPEEAREAGRKGGKAVSQNRLYMSEIGRKGGTLSRKRQLQKEKSTPRAGSIGEATEAEAQKKEEH